MPEKLPSRLDGFRRFAKDFTSGLDRREVGRLFDEDATRAFTVLAGDGRNQRQRDDGEGVSFEQVRDFFVGLAMKLSPARRLLFAVALLCPLLGFLGFEASIGEYRVVLDFSPFWFLVGLAGMTFLLALELVDRLRVRDELEVARHLQRDLLPRIAPTIDGFSIAHSYRTANEIGGDYYDFLPLADGRWVVAAGDASGHGMAAGLLMAVANASLRTAVELDPNPQPVLSLLNRVLYQTGGRRAFMTMFYGLLDPRDGTMVYANAGHPYPTLCSAKGDLHELGEGSLPLGLRQHLDIETRSLTIGKRETLVVYSDGIPEASSTGDDQPFGFEQLADELRLAGDAQQVHDRLIAAVDRHLKGRSPLDDLTLVVIERLA